MIEILFDVYSHGLEKITVIFLEFGQIFREQDLAILVILIVALANNFRS